MPHFSEEELRNLQRKWYQKLKEEGFKDIEDTSSHKRFLKACHSTYFQCRYHPLTFELKQEYYRRATQFYYDHVFDCETEKEIWKHHAEGLSLREISKLLLKQGLKFNKDRIHKVVTKLLAIMKTYSFNHDDGC